MLHIFFKTLPFFALIGTGWLAGRTRFFPPDATAWLTRFVFYFALSAMLFRFAAGLNVTELYDPQFVLAYLTGCFAVWAVGMGAARARGLPLPESAMEAQCCMIGNTGFLGVPMLLVLLGEAAVGPVLMVLTLDMVVFSTLITLIIHGARHGRITAAMVRPLLRGLAANPMIVSMLAGLAWGAAGWPLPGPLDEYLALLGAAATPGALFAIGASLAGRTPDPSQGQQGAHERPQPPPRIAAALWLSFAKLVLHPLAVGIAAFLLFDVAPWPAAVMVAAAALPVAGNVYILAQYFDVAVQRVSTAILVSTAASILTIPVVIHLITKG